MNVMRKEDLIRQFGQRVKENGAELTNKDAAMMVTEVVEAFKDLIYADGVDKVDISGFLSLEKVDKEARMCRNPKTGEQIQVAAKTVVKAKLAKKLKELQ